MITHMDDRGIPVRNRVCPLVDAQCLNATSFSPFQNSGSSNSSPSLSKPNLSKKFSHSSNNNNNTSDVNKSPNKMDI